MKQWLSDKKNQPIIIGLATIIIVLAVGGVLWQTGIIGGSPKETASAAVGGPPVGMVPGGPPVTPGAVPPTGPGSAGPFGGPAATMQSGRPGSPAMKTASTGMPVRPTGPARPGGMTTRMASAGGAAPGGFQSAPVGPVHARQDPFRPGFNAKRYAAQAIVPVAAFVATPNIASVNQMPGFNSGSPDNQMPRPFPSMGQDIRTASVALGRVSGIILVNGAHAIYESAGGATVVQPGDSLPDGQGKVVGIDADTVSVKVRGQDRVVKIPVSAGQTQGGGNGPPGGYPGAGQGYPTGIPPGMGGPPPGYGGGPQNYQQDQNVQE